MNGKIGETYNIGGGNEISNINIVKEICKVMDILRPLQNSGKYDNLITYVKDRPGHDFRYAIDSKKIFKELNWKPKEVFKSGIEKPLGGTWITKNGGGIFKKINTIKKTRLSLKYEQICNFETWRKYLE